MPATRVPAHYYNELITITDGLIQKWNVQTHQKFNFQLINHLASDETPYFYQNIHQKKVFTLEILTNLGSIKLNVNVNYSPKLASQLTDDIKIEWESITKLLIAYHHHDYDVIKTSYYQFQTQLQARQMRLIKSQDRFLDAIMEHGVGQTLNIAYQDQHLNIYQYNPRTDEYDIWLSAIDAYGKYDRRVNNQQMPDALIQTLGLPLTDMIIAQLDFNNQFKLLL